MLTSRNKKADPFALTLSGIYISYRLSGLEMSLHLPKISRSPVSHIGHLSEAAKVQDYTAGSCKVSESCSVSVLSEAICVSNLFFHMKSSIF